MYKYQATHDRHGDRQHAKPALTATEQETWDWLFHCAERDYQSRLEQGVTRRPTVASLFAQAAATSTSAFAAASSSLPFPVAPTASEIFAPLHVAMATLANAVVDLQVSASQMPLSSSNVSASLASGNPSALGANTAAPVLDGSAPASATSLSGATARVARVSSTIEVLTDAYSRAQSTSSMELASFHSIAAVHVSGHVARPLGAASHVVVAAADADAESHSADASGAVASTATIHADSSFESVSGMFRRDGNLS